MSIMKDNYGATWVKQTLKWFEQKTKEGIDTRELMKLAMLECGLRPNKAKELIAELQDLGFISANILEVKWIYNREPNPEMKPYLDAKKKLQKGEI